MLHTLQTAEQAAHIPAPPLEIPFSLSSKAQMLFEVLYGVAAHVSKRRGYHAAVSVVHFFAPAEIVAHACGMARSTLYVKLAELRVVGLVEARAHYTTHRGRTRSDGSVWAVKMRNFEGQPAKVPFDALKASYRCLSADISVGRTVWAQIGQSKGFPREQGAVEQILSWAIPPQPTHNADMSMTVRSDLERILDVPHVPKEGRAEAVDGAARVIAVSLGDAGGLMFWRWLLWQMLRLEASGRAAPWWWLFEQVRRAQAEKAEGYGRNSAALLVSRLKAAPWWDELRRLPPIQIGSPPLQA